MTKDETLKLALEALETNNKAWRHLADSGDAGFWEAEEQGFYELSVKAITTIKEALAQPWEKFCDSNCVWTDHHPDCKLAQQEPVAWYCKEGLERGVSLKQETVKWIPLYTKPPQCKWVGLTDEEMQDLWDRYAHMEMMRAIETKLKEKNT